MTPPVLYHGTCSVHHAAIMRDGLVPKPWGGPYLTEDRAQAARYATVRTQAWRGLREEAARAVVYRLRCPEGAVQRVRSVEPRKVLPGVYEWAAPGGVPAAWIAGHELLDSEWDSGRTDVEAASQLMLTAALDSGGQLRTKLERMGFSAEAAERLGAGMATAMTGAGAVGDALGQGQPLADPADGARLAALAWLRGGNG